MRFLLSTVRSILFKVSVVNHYRYFQESLEISHFSDHEIRNVGFPESHTNPCTYFQKLSYFLTDPDYTVTYMAKKKANLIRRSCCN